jgi:hypothetical protein
MINVLYKRFQTVTATGIFCETLGLRQWVTLLEQQSFAIPLALYAQL